jgi:hypothetical protein
MGVDLGAWFLDLKFEFPLEKKFCGWLRVIITGIGIMDYGGN